MTTPKKQTRLIKPLIVNLAIVTLALASASAHVWCQVLQNEQAGTDSTPHLPVSVIT
jgi:hypothetical protein